MTFPRFYPILDSTLLTQAGMDPVTAAEAMIEGGVGILQFRHKGEFTREVFELAQRVAERCRAAGVPLIVNDRADIALLVDGGVHVGQDDLPAADVRRLVGPDRIVGLSTHDLRQLEAALEQPVDYVAIGPVFLTRSKPNPDAVVGLEGVRAAAGRKGGRPLVAIGGITRANAREVLGAGADAVAVIRDMLPDCCTRQNLRARMEEWRQLVGM
jgi:thiamine-phosphate pyrophosphorylase